MEAQLLKFFPGIESELLQYVVGCLSDLERPKKEEVYDAVGELLLGSVEGSTENNVQSLCQALSDHLRLDAGSVDENEQKTVLDAPVKLSHVAEALDKEVQEVSSIWMKQRVDNTLVDQKKLEKAEAKLKQKNEKRQQLKTNGVPETSGSQEAAANQVVSRREQAQNGRVQDIHLENVDLSFGSKLLLEGANVTLCWGRRYGLVGRNGSGKSTLLRAISNRSLFIPQHFSLLHVEQEVVGDDTIALDSVLESDQERCALLKREQELTSTTRTQPVASPSASTDHAELMKVYARLAEIDSDGAPARASTILAGLGFSPAMQKQTTRQFSGGWRMRLALARALFSMPDLLLLDEPTNMLDLRAILWLEQYLQSWPSTLLVVSHDRSFLANVTTDIVHFHSKMLDCYRGNYTVFLQSKVERLRNQQREYEAQQQYRQHLQDFVDRWRYNAKRAPQAQSKLKILQKLPVLKPVIPEPEVILRFPQCEVISSPIVQLTEVGFGYTAEETVFTKVDLSIGHHARIAIVGANGAGKTTLLKLVLEELQPTSGYRHAHRNLSIGYFSQHHVDQMDLKLTSLELLADRFPGCREEQYRQQLGSYGVTGELATRPISTLSGGQKSRVAFAVMTWKSPNLLVLDEPTNHLDVESVEGLGKALAKFPGAVVLVSHDETLIDLVCEELWVCANGQVGCIEGGLAQYRKQLLAEMESGP